MGIADIVPGISGGTIAVVVGIYQNFIDTLSKLASKESLVYLKKFQLIEYFKFINSSFIIPLGIGIFTSIFILSHLIIYLFKNYPILMWSFFLGLIFTSTVSILRMADHVNFKRIIVLIFGTVIAYIVVSLNPVSQEDTTANYLVIFLSGFIALSAMMLPGISGSFLLVILGQYQIILTAIAELNLNVIFLFSLGGILSLALFSKFINWLLKKHFQFSIFLLSGFLLGSLKKIWPWKSTTNGFEENVTPFTYETLTGNSSYLFMSIFFFILAVTLVSFMEIWKNKSKKIRKI